MQIAGLVALLSFAPNAVMALLLFKAVAEARDRGVELWPLAFVWVITLAVLAAGLAYLLAGRLLAPLSRLSTQMGALTQLMARGSVQLLPMDAREPPEIARLRESFNQLVTRLGREQSRRGSATATLVHDLKTPLIASANLLKIVRDNDALPREERIQVVSELLREHQALLELVQKLVDAHKCEQPEMSLSRRRQSLAPLVQRVVERLQPLARDRGVTLEHRGDATVHVDAKEFERALYNLASNAVRYAKSYVKLDIYSGVIRLADDGPGLPAALEQLAQPFNAQPVEIAGQQYTAGTGGLGLFIARRIIEAHGGRLVTEASGAGGTVLLVYLGRAAGEADED